MHTHKNTQHRPFPHRFSPKKMVIAGLAALGLILLTMGMLLVFIAGPLQNSQELRKDAFVANGIAELQFSPASGATLPTNNGKQTIDVKINTHGLQTFGAQLVFDVIANDSIDELEVIFDENSGLKNSYLETKKVDHGYTIGFVGLPKDVSSTSYFTTIQPVTVLQLKVKPKKEGTISLNFNVERSKVISAANSQFKDELHTQEVVNYQFKNSTTTTTPNPTPDTTTADSRDDLFFYSLNDTDNKFTFYAAGTDSEVSPTQLEPNKSYKVKLTSKIQNIQKSGSFADQNLGVQLKVNDSITILGSVSYANIRNNPNGATVNLEGTFTAKNTNKFEIKIDQDNRIAERAEDNNTLVKEYTYGGTTSNNTGVSVKRCNETCSTNSECPTDYRCYNTGSEKRCRLATNVTATSCDNLPDQGIRRSCNQYCADSRECGAGLTCWYNQCRQPGNLNNTSCVAPATTSTTTKGGLTTSGTTVNGCNQACSTNRDCQSGLRCYKGSCRFPLNPVSTSCTADVVTGTTTQATPKPTIKPTATPKAATTSGTVTSPTPTPAPTLSPTPAATPVVLPQATSDESLSDTARIFFDTYLSALTTMPTLFGFPTPLVIIGAGVLLLLLAIILFAVSRRRKTIIETKPPVIIHQPGVTHQNPPVPENVRAQRATPPVSFIKTSGQPPIIQPSQTVMSSAPMAHNPTPLVQRPTTVVPKPVQPPTQPINQPPTQQVARTQTPTTQTITRPPVAPAVTQSTYKPAVHPVQNTQTQATVPVARPINPAPTIQKAVPTSTPPATPAPQNGISMLDRLKQKGITIDPTKKD